MHFTPNYSVGTNEFFLIELLPVGLWAHFHIEYFGRAGMDPISKGESQTHHLSTCLVRLNYFRIIILGRWFALGPFCPQEVIGRCVDTLLVVTLGCDWHLVGRIPRSAEHPTEPRAAPASRLTKNNYLAYHISSAQVEKPCPLKMSLRLL